MKSGKPRLIRQVNDRSVFEAIEETGVSTRAELSRITGGSAPTMAKAVKRLRQLGFLDEMGMSVPDGAGRPGRIFRIARNTSQVIGVVIDYRYCHVTAAGVDGGFTGKKVTAIKTPGDYRSLVRELTQVVKKLVASGPRTLAMGISVPGMLDKSQDRILLSPNMHLLDGQRVGYDLAAETGLTPFSIHETLAVCLAEQAYGVAKKLEHLVVISVLEGYGCSAVVGGQLLEGRDGMAGEMGHIVVDVNGAPCGCGSRGCIETVSTDQSLARMVSERVGEKLEIEEIIDRVKKGGLSVDQELARALDYLAIGVASAINTFNPELVLVASRMFELSPAAFDEMVNAVRKRALRPLADRCRISPSNGDKLKGAVAAAVRGLKNSLGPTMNWR